MTFIFQFEIPPLAGDSADIDQLLEELNKDFDPNLDSADGIPDLDALSEQFPSTKVSVSL